jgi:hypothetical protein
MRNRIAVFAATLACALAHAQAPQGCDTPESHRLDFWLGEWKLTYTQNGKEGTSHNRIAKTLDGCAIFEEFTGPPGVPLQGRSMSMFDRVAMRWKQVWVDNSGAWLDFAGDPAADGGMVFSRAHAQRPADHAAHGVQRCEARLAAMAMAALARRRRHVGHAMGHPLRARGEAGGRRLK